MTVEQLEQLLAEIRKEVGQLVEDLDEAVHTARVIDEQTLRASFLSREQVDEIVAHINNRPSGLHIDASLQAELYIRFATDNPNKTFQGRLTAIRLAAQDVLEKAQARAEAAIEKALDERVTFVVEDDDARGRADR